jgi:hypothetical protein
MDEEETHRHWLEQGVHGRIRGCRPYSRSAASATKVTSRELSDRQSA